MQITKRTDYPFYQQAVSVYLEGDVKRFFRLRKAIRLSKTEAALLECRALIRERIWKKAKLVLTELKPETGSFFTAEKHFLNATICFFQNDFSAAAAFNVAAFEFYGFSQDQRGRFISAYNAMVDFSRLGKDEEAHAYFTQAQNAAASPAERILIVRAMACECSLQRRYSEAFHWICEAMAAKDILPIVDQQTLEVVAIDIFFRAGKIRHALDLLNTKRAEGRNWELARLDFEISALNAIENNHPMPNPPEAVLTSPEYGLKWNIVIALQAGEERVATKLWQELMAANPGKYEREFKFKNLSDEDSLFGVLISRLKTSMVIENISVVSPEMGALEKLNHFLFQSAFPIRKEDLIERIWNVSYDPRFDARFYKLVERAKKKGTPIISKKNAYSVDRIA